MNCNSKDNKIFHIHCHWVFDKDTIPGQDISRKRLFPVTCRFRCWQDNGTEKWFPMAI